MISHSIQPFWAIPLLAAARIKFRKVMGNCLNSFSISLTLVSLATFVVTPNSGRKCELNPRVLGTSQHSSHYLAQYVP